MRARVLEPEFLDTLPADDPRALRSRRDLRRINALMFQARILAGLVAPLPPPRTVLELGAGDGRLFLNIARRFSEWRGVRLVLLDRQNTVTRETRVEYAKRGWKVETPVDDVFAFLSRQEKRGYDLVVANLFLHHFTDSRLRDLFSEAARVAPAFAATEPERSRLAMAGAACLPLLLCNDVTRHDSLVSVRAGFKGEELSALWPRAGWRLCEGTRLFTHVFSARRSNDV